MCSVEDFFSYLPIYCNILVPCFPAFVCTLSARHISSSHRIENSCLPLSTLSHPTEVQPVKLHANFSNLPMLLHFWNLVSESLSTSLSPKGTSHRFLAVKEWRLLWNMTVVLIAQSTATAGRLKESTVCYGQGCDVEEWASVNVSQGLFLLGSFA